jgi:alpha/beta superfamily hydrolase
MTTREIKVEKPAIGGPEGAIETMIERPADARDGIIAICCHPHPLYGGTMQNKVVHTLARCAQDQQVTSLRFNFRGVGKSAGVHANGIGETDDAVAIVDWCRQRLGVTRFWSLGFSFGSYVAFRLAALRGAAALVTVAPPVQRFDFSRLETPVVEILPGAEHFFHGRLTELRARVGAWLAARLAEKA